MFFLQDTYFLVGGVEFSLKNPCAVGILFLALLNFTVTVRPGRTIVLMRHTVIQVFPYLIPFFFSAIIWVVSGADSITIVNGVGMIVPQILSVLIAAATLYLFGEKGALYCLGAMCVANFIKVLTVAMEGGIGDFLEEFYQLLVSFSAENGPLMQQLEINDLTFAFGPFLIYLLLWRKKIPHTFLWFFVTLVLFLLGFKKNSGSCSRVRICCGDFCADAAQEGGKAGCHVSGSRDDHSKFYVYCGDQEWFVFVYGGKTWH